MPTPDKTRAELEHLIREAGKLGFYDDVVFWESELRRLNNKK